MFHAWYSAKTEQKSGSMNYQGNNGEIIKATAISKDINFKPINDDTIYVGQVVKMITFNAPIKTGNKWIIEGNDIF